jgi:hypothetical protein
MTIGVDDDNGSIDWLLVIQLFLTALFAGFVGLWLVAMVVFLLCQASSACVLRAIEINLNKLFGDW